MKKLMAILLTGYVIVMSQGVRKVVAGDDNIFPLDRGDKIPLSALAGIYSITVHGSIFLCFEPHPPFPPAQCGSPGSIGVPLSIVSAGASTSDAKGNGCATATETISGLPVDVNPTGVVVLHSVGKVTNYDPTTGTGDVSFTDYIGGQCHGATFDSTGATLNDTGTEHFTVSNHGRRIDVVITSLTSNPEGAFGGFSISGTLLRH